MSKRVQVVPGDRYGRLTVIREVSPRISGGQRQRCVECKCDCVVVGEYRLYSLRNGNTSSCGCLPREMPNSTTHGLSNTSEYRIWQGMLRRCYLKSEVNFHHYGGRGISICGGWRESFVNFYKDMGQRPSLKHSIDRMNNDGNYSCGHCDECVEKGWPLNCRWATQKEQTRNTRVNYLVEYGGETKCVAEWAEQYGIKPTILYARLVSLGWTFEKSVSWPVSVRNTRTRNPHYRVPMRDRDAAWHREHERLEVKRIADDRRLLKQIGDNLATTHRLDPSEFKSRVDAFLVDGFTWNGAVMATLQDMGAI